MKVTFKENEKPNLTLKDLWYGDVFCYKNEEDNDEECEVLMLIVSEKSGEFGMIDLETGSYFHDNNGDQPVKRLDAEIIVHKN